MLQNKITRVESALRTSIQLIFKLWYASTSLLHRIFTPFSWYRFPSTCTRFPSLSKKRPPAIIWGNPKATFTKAKGGDKHSILCPVPWTESIRGAKSAATVSGSSANVLKNRRAIGVESFNNKSVRTMPGDKLCTPMLLRPAGGECKANKTHCYYHQEQWCKISW